MYETVSKKVFPFIKTMHGDKDSAFTKYMDDAIFMIPTPQMLEKIVTNIDGLPVKEGNTTDDTKGDLYEYLLSKVATAGTNGQFRTPRHIIKMMVELMQPTPTDIIVDPAAGSAGFLVEAGEYLKRNNISMKEIAQDSTVSVELYRITDYKTVKNPYEGHYLHYETKTKSEFKNIKFRKGDFLISTKQVGVKYLLETLEPEATDSFFNWNFFDAILGQKEYFSDYVFEDTAAELLKNNQVLRTAFEMEKLSKPDFAKDGRAQLDWIYRHSEYYEGSVGLYPIFRIN